MYKCILIVVLLVLPFATAESLSESKLAKYKEIEYNLLRISPEKYRSDKVVFTARFMNFSTTFFPYMEKSGFTTTRYIGLIIGEFALPTIGRKKKDLEAQVATLKKGSNVKVYGKVYRFKSQPINTMLPHYYIQLHQLEVLETPKEEFRRRLNENRQQRGRNKQGGGGSGAL